MNNTKALEGTIQAIANLAASVADSTSNEYEAEIRYLRAQLAERDAQLAAMQWQPIETAPKDGSWIIVEGGTASWGYGCQAWVSGISGRKLEWQPKWWMPIPRQPTQDKGEL